MTTVRPANNAGLIKPYCVFVEKDAACTAAVAFVVNVKLVTGESVDLPACKMHYHKHNDLAARKRLQSQPSN